MKTLLGRRWPFWLLLAAWLCANSPQAAVYAGLAWLAEARTFSHQRDLSREVAHLLVGEAAGSRVAAAIAKRSGSEPRKPAPLVPASAVLKRIDLAAETLADAMPPGAADEFGWEAEERSGRTRRAAPPHGPPRVGVA